MTDYKIYLGYLAIIISFGSYIPYVKSILSGKVKPHAFSWLVWALLTAIAFFGQLAGNGGLGAWVTASTAVVCLLVFVLALFKGEKNFAPFDWYALAASFIALILWVFTKNPLYSVILVTVIDALGFLPTFRKGYDKPNEESLLLWSASTIKYTLGLVALKSYSLVTWLFPASLVLTNLAFVLMILYRRKQLTATGFIAVSAVSLLAQIDPHQKKTFEAHQDTPQNYVLLHGDTSSVAGTFTGSAFAVIASWPLSELRPTKYINRHGNSYYEVPSQKNDFFKNL